LGGIIMADSASPAGESNSTTTPSVAPKASGGRRWLRRFSFVVFVALIGGAWFAPEIVARTSLRQHVVKLLLPNYPGAIEIGSASLGWMSPIVVRDLRADDSDGRTLLQVKEFSTRETLLSLATRPGTLGRLRLVGPVVNVSFRDAGSNLEDVLKTLLGGPSSSRAVAFELEVVDASINLAYKQKSLTSTLQPVSINIASSKGGIDDLELTIGTVPSKDEPTPTPPTDWLAARFGSTPIGEAVAMTVGSRYVRFKSQGWKLDKLLPALARFEPDAELAGELDADIKLQIEPPKDDADWSTREWKWDGDITLRQLLLAGLSSLKRDRVELKTASVGGHVASHRGQLSMENVRLTTDVGEVTATGQAPLAGLTNRSVVDTFQTILSDDDYQIQGHVDLKQLAALLPTTLQIRERTEITGGRAEWKLEGVELQGARHWAGKASVSGLTAVKAGETIEWKEPVSLNLAAHREKNSIQIERITCQSDFLTLTGSGTLTDASFAASGDLNKLATNLERFVDLGAMKLAGRMKSEGTIRREGSDRTLLAAHVRLDDFQWTGATRQTWHEKHLELSASAGARTDSDGKLMHVDTAELRLASGNDLLAGRLTESVELNHPVPTWPVACTLTGDLSSWQTRLQPFVALSGWQLGGQAKIELDAVAGSKEIRVTKFSGDFEQLTAQCADWFIREPQLKLQSSGIWKSAEREWSSPITTLTGTALSCQVDNLKLAMTDKSGLAQLAGDAVFRGDLDKLSRWKNDALPRPSYYLQGAMAGRATLAERDSAISVDFEATVDKLLVADLELQSGQQLHWVALWREPQVRLTGRGSYDQTADRMKLDSAELQSSGLSLTASGSLDQTASLMKADFSGELGYDWSVLSERFGDSLKKNLQLQGKAKRPVSLKGTLASLLTSRAPSSTAAPSSSPVPSSPGVPAATVSFGHSESASNVVTSDLCGQAGLGWDSAVFEGLTVGPGDVAAKLDQGVCQFAPLDVTVGEGRLHFTPQVRLDRNPALVVLPKEKVVDQVRLSPDVCSTWLKFVAPMLANSTQVDGKFSLDIEGGTLPVNSLTSGELSGALAIHHANVRPGPLTLQVVNLIDQVQSILQQRPRGTTSGDKVLMEMPEQSVGFKLANNRIQHQSVTFLIGDVIVRSSGSVGTDETLDVTLQIPIRDEWTTNNRVFAKMKGQTLQIPMRGTLSRPQIDGQVLGELTKMMGGAALDGLLQDKVDDLFNKKLNQFLPGRK
jgi:translocation and assembly module TamB